MGLSLFALPISRRSKLNASVARRWIKAERPKAFATQLVMVLWGLLLQFDHISLELLYICFQRADFIGLLLRITVITV